MSEITDVTQVLGRLQKAEAALRTLVDELRKLPPGNRLRQIADPIEQALGLEGVTPSTADTADSSPEPPAEVTAAAHQLGVEATDLWAWVRGKLRGSKG